MPDQQNPPKPTPQELEDAKNELDAFLDKAPTELIHKLGQGRMSFDKIKGRVSLSVKGTENE
jgi:hypothetical protein